MTTVTGRSAAAAGIALRAVRGPLAHAPLDHETRTDPQRGPCTPAANQRGGRKTPTTTTTAFDGDRAKRHDGGVGHGHRC